MRFLLDTHTVLWAGLTPALLGRRASAAIADDRNELLVSAASAWEIATKVRLGKLPQAQRLESDLVSTLKRSGYTFQAITVEDGLRAGRLVGVHGDPFDRMIAAQALAEDIPVISSDAKLDVFGVRRIW